MKTAQIEIDKLKRNNWSDQELKNAELVVDFVQHLMNDHDFDYVLKKFDRASYVQHNRSMSDGVKAVVDYISKFVNQFPDFAYDVKHIYVDGQYVTLHSHSTLSKKDRGNPDKGFNIIDVWKVENDQLIEHWDAIQPINGFMRLYALFSGGSKRNNNTLF